MRAGRALHTVLVWLVSLGALLSAAPEAVPQTGAAPDFRLRDVNPRSARYGDTVSPRDYRLQISAYYFGAAG